MGEKDRKLAGAGGEGRQKVSKGKRGEAGQKGSLVGEGTGGQEGSCEFCHGLFLSS